MEWGGVLSEEQDTRRLGALLAECCATGLVIFLVGALGTGKTTLTRGFLRGLGYGGAVKSPTYTLIEPYAVAGRRVIHLDLYRVADAEELEHLGLRDLLDSEALVLIEWPEKGAGFLPAADLQIRLDYVSGGREAHLHAFTQRGVRVIDGLRQQWTDVNA